MMDMKIPARYWPFAVKAAAHDINVLPNEDKSSAYEKWEKVKPPYKRLRIFGCLVCVRVPKHKLSKLDARVIEGAMLGYTKNGYIIGIAQDRIVYTRDLSFDETSLIHPLALQDASTRLFSVKPKKALEYSHGLQGLCIESTTMIYKHL
jgi:hypothetical protein